MRKLIHDRYKAFRIGPLDIAPINKAMKTELDPADVWVSKACHAHIANDHPNDYPIIMANFVEIIRSPTMVGQDPKHGENFYLVKRIPVGDQSNFILVAIGLTLSQHGTFNVRTAYRLSQADIDSRRLRGSLKSLA
jgi:phage-Barnase-EndoU-ColicinE5/D-RelE like nuclease3